MQQYIIVFMCNKCGEKQHVYSETEDGRGLSSDWIPTKHFVNQGKETRYFCGRFEKQGVYKLQGEQHESVPQKA